MQTGRRILLLIVLAGILGATANALSPRGLSWSRPLGRGIAAQVADAGLAIVETATIKDLLADSSVIFIDARSPEEYQTGRLPGAVRGPLPPSTPLDRPIVVYCGNEFCEEALDQGRALRKTGYRNVAVYVDGYEAWWNAGGTVDQD